MTGLVFLVASCSPAFWQGVGQGLAASGGGQVSPAPLAAVQLLIFGGSDHGTFLGCLNCAEYDASSVLNEIGPHGSSIAPESVLNRLSQFGSVFSPVSACNPIASNPPVIVDRQGKFYGRLTVNWSHPQVTRIQAIREWIAQVCAD